MVLIYSEEKYPLLEQLLGDWVRMMIGDSSLARLWTKSGFSFQYDVEMVVAESVNEDDDDESVVLPLEYRTPGIRKKSCVENSPCFNEYANGFDTRNFPETIKTPQCKTDCRSGHFNVSKGSFCEVIEDVRSQISDDDVMIVEDTFDDTPDTIGIVHDASGRLPSGFANEMVVNESGEQRFNESPESVANRGGNRRCARVAESQTIDNANRSLYVDGPQPTEDLSDAQTLHASTRNNRDKRNGTPLADGDKVQIIDEKMPQLETNDAPFFTAVPHGVNSYINENHSKKAMPNGTNIHMENGSPGIALPKNVSTQGSEFVVHPTQVVARNDVQVFSDDDMELDEPLQSRPVKIKNSASQRNGTSSNGNRQQSVSVANSDQHIAAKQSHQRRNVHSLQVISQAERISSQIPVDDVIPIVDLDEENEIGERNCHKTQDHVRTHAGAPHHSTQVVNRVESVSSRIRNARLTVVVRDSIDIKSQIAADVESYEEDAIADPCKNVAVDRSRTPDTPIGANLPPPPVLIRADSHSTPDEIFEIHKKRDALPTSQRSTRSRVPNPPNADAIEIVSSTEIRQTERVEPKAIIVAQPKRAPLIASAPAIVTNSLPRPKQCCGDFDDSIYEESTQKLPGKNSFCDGIIVIDDDEDDEPVRATAPPKPRQKAAKENESPKPRKTAVSRAKASAPSKPRQKAATRAKSAPKKPKKTPAHHVNNFLFQTPKAKNRGKANDLYGPVSPCSDIVSMESIGRGGTRKRKLFSKDSALEDLDDDADEPDPEPKRRKTQDFDEILETTVSSCADLEDGRKKNPEQYMKRVAQNMKKLSQPDAFDLLKMDSEEKVATVSYTAYRASLQTTKSRVNNVESKSTKRSTCKTSVIWMRVQWLGADTI